MKSIFFDFKVFFYRYETKLADEQQKTYDKFKEEKTEENVTKAFQAHYNTIYQVLNGTMKLSKDETKKLDENMENILKELIKQKVDKDSQSNTLSSKFFNALGWSSSNARIVDSKDLEDGGKERKEKSAILWLR